MPRASPPPRQRDCDAANQGTPLQRFPRPLYVVPPVKAIAAVAKRCGVTLYSDEETSAAAIAMAARVDEEIQQLQRTGKLKSVNRSYRIYRIETTARGETALPYAKWLDEYKANLVRQLAAALRFS